jgi:hypothetical protein
MKKEDAAFILYANDLELKIISEVLAIPYNTVIKWSSKYNWKKKKTEKTIADETNQDRILLSVSFQLKIMSKIIEIRERELETTHTVEGLEKLMFDKGSLDAFQKLYSTIKSKDISWDQIVKSTRELLEFVEKEDFKLAKELQPYANQWLNEKREGL